MKELKFIHITKCAGTTVEDIGKENNINWGRFHKEYRFWHQVFPHKPDKLKLKYDWFMVVRNPYERLISEFYCKWGGIGKQQNIDHIDESMFNLYIKQRILNRLSSGNHYTEQYKYIDKNISVHILHFENIESEFNKLMIQYQLDIRLDRKINQSKFTKKFNIQSFSPELIEFINEIYHLDFTTFGYNKIQPNKEI